MHPSEEIHLYICISSIYANNVVVLPLSIFIWWHMDLVPHCILSTADSSHNSSEIGWDVIGYKLSNQ